MNDVRNHCRQYAAANGCLPTASPFGADVAAADIVASRAGDHLVLQRRGSAEQVTIQDYFRKNAAGGYVADEVRFADGRLWQMRPGQERPGQERTGQERPSQERPGALIPAAAGASPAAV